VVKLCEIGSSSFVLKPVSPSVSGFRGRTSRGRKTNFCFFA